MKLSAKLGLASFVSVLAVFFLVSCVDVDNPNVTTVDLRTLTKFVYLNSSSDVLTITLDGTQVAQLSTEGETTYLSIPSGSRKVRFDYSGGTKNDTTVVPFPQDAKVVFYCVSEPAAGDTTLVYQIVQSHTTYDGSVQYAYGKTMVRFVNLSKISSRFTLQNGTVSKTTATLSFGKVTAYDTVDVAPQFFAVNTATSDTVVANTQIGTTEGRYSVVLFGSGSSIKAKVIKED